MTSSAALFRNLPDIRPPYCIQRGFTHRAHGRHQKNDQHGDHKESHWFSSPLTKSRRPGSGAELTNRSHHRIKAPEASAGINETTPLMAQYDLEFKGRDSGANPHSPTSGTTARRSTYRRQVTVHMVHLTAKEPRAPA